MTSVSFKFNKVYVDLHYYKTFPKELRFNPFNLILVVFVSTKLSQNVKAEGEENLLPIFMYRIFLK